MIETNLKRYLVFAGSQYYPSGGWADFQFAVDYLDDIKPEIIRRTLEPKDYEESFGYCDWIQVIDIFGVPLSRQGYPNDSILPEERELGLIRIASMAMKKRNGTLDYDEEDIDLYKMDEYVKIEPPQPRKEYKCMICEKMVIGSHECKQRWENGEEVSVRE